MNNYGLKNRTRISNSIENKLLEELKQLSAKTQIPMSKLLHNAIKLLLDSRKPT